MECLAACTISATSLSSRSAVESTATSSAAESYGLTPSSPCSPADDALPAGGALSPPLREVPPPLRLPEFLWPGAGWALPPSAALRVRMATAPAWWELPGWMRAVVAGLLSQVDARSSTTATPVGDAACFTAPAAAAPAPLEACVAAILDAMADPLCLQDVRKVSVCAMVALRRFLDAPEATVPLSQATLHRLVFTSYVVVAPGCARAALEPLASDFGVHGDAAAVREILARMTGAFDTALHGDYTLTTVACARALLPYECPSHESAMEVGLVLAAAEAPVARGVGCRVAAWLADVDADAACVL